jgi:hypothetical protein
MGCRIPQCDYWGYSAEGYWWLNRQPEGLGYDLGGFEEACMLTDVNLTKEWNPQSEWEVDLYLLPWMVGV